MSKQTTKQERIENFRKLFSAVYHICSFQGLEC
nr:MAG TPA: hypothetical protein [Caudoviricetes sp.]